jgi:hypothetical protein
MKRKAYSYARFSTARQIAGRSTQRQDQNVQAFLAEHNLDLVHSMIDSGVKLGNR